VFIRFVVDADPVPQPRPKFRGVLKAGRPVAVAIGDRKAAVTAFRGQVAMFARRAAPAGRWPLDAAYRLLVIARVVRPKVVRAALTHPPCHRKPDADNYLKAVQDAAKGILWSDDGRIFDARLVKLYAAPGAAGSVEVCVAARPPAESSDPGSVVLSFLSGEGPDVTRV